MDHLMHNDAMVGVQMGQDGINHVMRDHDGMAHDDAMMTGHMGMSPFLFTSTTGFYVLFKEAYVTSSAGFAGAFFASMFFAWFVTWFSAASRVWEKRVVDAPRLRTPVSELIIATLFALRHAGHYFAMLLVMTMNVGIICAVVLGHGFGWLSWQLLEPRGKLRLLVGMGEGRFTSKEIVGDDQIEVDACCVGTTGVAPAFTERSSRGGCCGVTAKVGEDNKLCQCSGLECGCDPKKCNQTGGCQCEIKSV